MAQPPSWQSLLRKEQYERIIENVSEIPRPPYFPPLDVNAEPGALGIRWENWIDRFDNFLDALDIQKEHVKRAMLFYYVGEDVCNIFVTLPMTGGDNDYELAKNRLTEYFVPMQDNVYETHTFRKLTQEKGETIHQYEARLREFANRCHFKDIDKQIKSRMILTCNMPRLRRRAQKEPNLTLQDILSIGRAIELEQMQHKTDAAEAARMSVTSLKSNKSLGEKDDETETKCWGKLEKLFGSCAGGAPLQESDEESEPEVEPKEEVKVVLLEMTPQMRQIRELKKSQSIPESKSVPKQVPDDKTGAENTCPRHSHSQDGIVTSLKKKDDMSETNEREHPKRPAKQGQDGSRSPRKKREKPKGKETEPKSPAKENEREQSKSPVKQDNSKSPQKEPNKLDKSQPKDGGNKKPRKHRKSRDNKADDKKGILKKDQIEITITSPQEGAVDGADGEAGSDTIKRTDKSEKGKVTFSSDTKEPIVGKYNPPSPDISNDSEQKDGKAKDIGNACKEKEVKPKDIDNDSDKKEDMAKDHKEECVEDIPLKDSKESEPMVGSEQSKQLDTGSPERKQVDEKKRRPSRDLM